MAVPPTVARLISEVGGLVLPGILAETPVSCEGAKFHSPQPMLVSEFIITRAGLVEHLGATAPDSVWLCGTCSGNVNVMLSLLAAHGGNLPWEARREFGNLVRAIAMRAYKEGSA